MGSAVSFQLVIESLISRTDPRTDIISTIVFLCQLIALTDLHTVLRWARYICNLDDDVNNPLCSQITLWDDELSLSF